MRSGVLCTALACGLAAGCASSPDSRDRDVAPYKAFVVFKWSDEDSAQQGPGGGGVAGNSQPVLRTWIEDEIILGLEDHEVFSDFLVVTERELTDGSVEREKPDLLVEIRIGRLAEWKKEEIGIDPKIAVLNTALWFGTAIGGWWVPDQKFPTQSEVEVSWKRLEKSRTETEFQLPERLPSTGEYKLSFWDRAKLWRAPGAYLMNLFCPPSLVPLRDEDEVTRSLITTALADIKRELAQRLRENLRSGGAPFLFRQEEPPNGSTLDGDSAKLSYRYRIEPGFKDHEQSLLRSLRVEIKRGDKDTYELLSEYDVDRIDEINELIDGDEKIDLEVTKLGPGLNLIRFSALTELKRTWITNTIAIMRP